MRYIVYQAYLLVTHKVFDSIFPYGENRSFEEFKIAAKALNLPDEYEIVYMDNQLFAAFNQICFYIRSKKLKTLKHGQAVPELLVEYETIPAVPQKLKLKSIKIKEQYICKKCNKDLPGQHFLYCGLCSGCSRDENLPLHLEAIAKKAVA